MRTSATGISISRSSSSRAAARGRRAARGFTLLELMIVVFVIGLVTAGVVISFSGGSRDEQLERESDRLDALFDYVREQAELQTRDYGFRINRRGYSFVVYDVLANQWRPAEEDDALRERPFPEGIETEVVVEGRTVVLETRKKDIEDFMPQVMIFSNGDISSFEVILRREGANERDNRSRIYSDESGNINLLQPGEVEEKGQPVRAARRP
ncbi:MAG: type II secretion system minor pseudopilin GspH [Steroidobacteraceae bacterium]|nr:type II secretion system minor pseudopilin GspH [Steroidobacteraceae bacterium]